jgi:hypothetical protein
MTGFFNLLFGQRLTDFATGHEGDAPQAPCRSSGCQQNGWEHGAEIAALIALSGHQIAEIAVDYAPRQSGSSKMRHLREAVRVVYFLVRYRLRGRTD